MRHLRGGASIEVALLPRGVVGLACLGLLVTAAGRPDRVAAPELGARVAAVDVAVIAPPAQEEDPATTAAADEAQRVHGSGRDRQELDADLAPCDDHLVDPGSGCAT
jgi:hypothetical protein